MTTISRRLIFLHLTNIEKDLMINDQIERLRLSTVASLLSGRRDIVVVSECELHIWYGKSR